jgi:hypothetical protein
VVEGDDDPSTSTSLGGTPLAALLLLFTFLNRGAYTTSTMTTTTATNTIATNANRAPIVTERRLNRLLLLELSSSSSSSSFSIVSSCLG